MDKGLQLSWFVIKIHTPPSMGSPHSRTLLPIFLTIILPFSATAQSYSNISLGSSIAANNADSPWMSPSGDFAFGFQQVAPGGYLLAIWFDKIPEKTIVWSANRDNPAPQGSRIQLLPDGRLELSDPGGRRIWAANSAGPGVAYAAMLDSGNFVLESRTSAVLWQSFDEPTDTVLPTQIVNQGTSLISSFSEKNPSRGRFMLILQKDGNLVLYTRNFPTYDVISAYWSSRTVGTGFLLIFNESGYIYLTAKDGTILYFLSSNEVPTSRFYQRLTLEYDGVLRHYLYPKSGDSAWSVNVYFPSNICLRILQDTGGGACGYNSLCSLGIDQRPTCACPKGYSLIDPKDRLGGCKSDSVQQSCDGDPKEAELYSFVDMADTDWPLSDYAHYQPVSEDWCRHACLVDCFCAVAIYRESNCWKKKIPLSNGRIDATVGGKALIKIRNENATRNF